MARPTNEMKLRNNTYEALLLELEKSGNNAQYYKDQVEEYIKFYDNLTTINKELNKYKDRIADSDEYTKLLKEKRLVAKEMRNILTFLNIKADGVSYDTDEDEEL